MALTLEADQRLEKVGLVAFFVAHKVEWTTAAKRTYKFIKESFPQNSIIRRDDVAKALLPILEVHSALRNKLSAGKLTQKFWVTDFTDLIIDRVWDEIT
jgi:hypothetical protein